MKKKKALVKMPLWCYDIFDKDCFFLQRMLQEKFNFIIVLYFEVAEIICI